MSELQSVIDEQVKTYNAVGEYMMGRVNVGLTLLKSPFSIQRAHTLWVTKRDIEISRYLLFPKKETP